MKTKKVKTLEEIQNTPDDNLTKAEIRKKYPITEKMMKRAIYSLNESKLVTDTQKERDSVLRKIKRGAIATMKAMNADYQPSHYGDKARWKVIPQTLPAVRFWLVGTNASTLAINPSGIGSPRFIGTYTECEARLKERVALWFKLPVGREIECDIKEAK